MVTQSGIELTPARPESDLPTSTRRLWPWLGCLVGLAIFCAALRSVVLSPVNDMAAARLLPYVAITGVIALAAFGLRSRAAYVCGAGACWLAFLIPQPRVYAHYRDAESAHMGAVHDTLAHGWKWGTGAGIVGVVTGLMVSRRVRRPRVPTTCIDDVR